MLRRRKISYEFLAEFSHAVKTPILTIKLLLDLIPPSVLSGNKRDTIEKIRTAKENLEYVSELLNRYLEFSRIESVAGIQTPERIYLNGFVAGIVERQKINFKFKKVALQYHCRQSMIKIKADPLMLSQAIINLLENALKFTPESGKVTVSVRKNNGFAHISVIDTGKGIAPDCREKIFEKYFQVRDCAGNKYSSVGLGLAITKKIAELHKGRIILISAVPKGSNFTLILPL